MKVPAILRQLEQEPVEEAPYEALRAAAKQREAIIPELLGLLDRVRADPEATAAREGYWGHVFALALLAQFREPAAYPLVVELFSLPEDLAARLWRGADLDLLHRVLAVTSHSDLSGMKKLLEDIQGDEVARCAVIEAMVDCVALGDLQRHEVVAYFRELFGGRLPREANSVWDELIWACLDLRATELLPEIERAFADELVDPYEHDLDDVHESFSEAEEETRERLATRAATVLIEDAAEEFLDWDFTKSDSRY